MEKETEITLVSRFETAYKEFKEYGKFFFAFAKEVKEKRQEQAKFLEANIEDSEKVQNYILEYASLPVYYSQDLDKLKERLITIYELIEDSVEFSAEIKTEMAEVVLKKNPILFKIVEGKAVSVNDELMQELKLKAKENYTTMIAGLKE